jgi:hypothetical protein
MWIEMEIEMHIEMGIEMEMEMGIERMGIEMEIRIEMKMGERNLQQLWVVMETGTVMGEWFEMEMGI